MKHEADKFIILNNSSQPLILKQSSTTALNLVSGAKALRRPKDRSATTSGACSPGQSREVRRAFWSQPLTLPEHEGWSVLPPGQKGGPEFIRPGAVSKKGYGTKESK